MAEAFQVATTPVYIAEKPVRNPRYKQWIKRFACIACGSTRLVDPCHTGPHGHGTKSADTSCLPLCRKCHDAFDADPRGFAARHDLDIAEKVSFFNHLWSLKQDGNQGAQAAPSSPVVPGKESLSEVGNP